MSYPANGLLKVADFKFLNDWPSAPESQRPPESLWCLGAFLAPDHLDDGGSLLVQPLELGAIAPRQGVADPVMPREVNLEWGAEPAILGVVFPLDPDAESICGPKVPVWPDSWKTIVWALVIVAAVHEFKRKGGEDRVSRGLRFD